MKHTLLVVEEEEEEVHVVPLLPHEYVGRRTNRRQEEGVCWLLVVDLKEAVVPVALLTHNSLSLSLLLLPHFCSSSSPSVPWLCPPPLLVVVEVVQPTMNARWSSLEKKQRSKSFNSSSSSTVEKDGNVILKMRLRHSIQKREFYIFLVFLSVSIFQKCIQQSMDSYL